MTVVKEGDINKIELHIVGVQGTYCFDIKTDLNYNADELLIGKKVCDGAAKFLLPGATPYP